MFPPVLNLQLAGANLSPTGFELARCSRVAECHSMFSLTSWTILYRLWDVLNLQLAGVNLSPTGFELARCSRAGLRMSPYLWYSWLLVSWYNISGRTQLASRCCKHLSHQFWARVSVVVVPATIPTFPLLTCSRAIQHPSQVPKLVGGNPRVVTWSPSLWSHRPPTLVAGDRGMGAHSRDSSVYSNVHALLGAAALGWVQFSFITLLWRFSDLPFVIVGLSNAAFLTKSPSLWSHRFATLFSWPAIGGWVRIHGIVACTVMCTRCWVQQHWSELQISFFALLWRFSDLFFVIVGFVECSTLKAISLILSHWWWMREVKRAIIGVRLVSTTILSVWVHFSYSHNPSSLVLRGFLFVLIYIPCLQKGTGPKVLGNYSTLRDFTNHTRNL